MKSRVERQPLVDPLSADSNTQVTQLTFFVDNKYILRGCVLSLYSHYTTIHKHRINSTSELREGALL